MREILSYLKLIRYTNLIIIVLTQYFFRYFVIIPLYKAEEVIPPTSNLFFLLLVVSTVFIAAAGYAINDYFDMRVDHINKPEKMLLGRIIPRRMAILIHGVFTGLGIFLSFVAAFMIGAWKLGFISVIIAYTLWQYSHKFKASFITGNVIIALFSAFVIFIVWLFELYAQMNTGHALILGKNFFTYFMLAYMFFAFITSLVREIIKDIEDIEGDTRVGCETIPIKLGIQKAKTISYALTFLNMAFLGILAYLFLFRFNLLSLYFIFLIILFAYLLMQIKKAKEKEDYSYTSIYIKVIMFAGLLSMQLIYINF